MAHCYSIGSSKLFCALFIHVAIVSCSDPFDGHNDTVPRGDEGPNEFYVFALERFLGNLAKGALSGAVNSLASTLQIPGAGVLGAGIPGAGVLNGMPGGVMQDQAQPAADSAPEAQPVDLDAISINSCLSSDAVCGDFISRPKGSDIPKKLLKQEPLYTAPVIILLPPEPTPTEKLEFARAVACLGKMNSPEMRQARSAELAEMATIKGHTIAELQAEIAEAQEELTKAKSDRRRVQQELRQVASNAVEGGASQADVLFLKRDTQLADEKITIYLDKLQRLEIKLARAQEKEEKGEGQALAEEEREEEREEEEGDDFEDEASEESKGKSGRSVGSHIPRLSTGANELHTLN
ncbi:uncharacterized protein LOC34620773 [Cyclospora cayetanensis]|uniref:Uncharacterized protein LOC34620773 n=1 Tax=Cyclospora cayetanensis TaxID=88456 RepID=A0A6P6RTU8_9EIME|nr:uncharacterized protein LOC34620773 [Cyclospora cayetanensis]